MEENEASPIDESPIPPQTAPESFSVSLRGFDTTDRAERYAECLGHLVRELSSYFDLSGLDGITVAFDYRQALCDLDLGIPTTYQLTPSEGNVVGVAMTPSVLRGGKVKSHIVFNAEYVIALEDPAEEHFDFALHLLAHECAHVDATHQFDKAFPGILLQSRASNVHQTLRWRIIQSCWDEYAATRLSRDIGRNPVHEYEETFIQALGETRETANNAIRAYRLHADVRRVLDDVYGAYGRLMKFACYLLGNMAGTGVGLDDLPNTRTALACHWFAPYFERLGDICQRLAEEYGAWRNQKIFEELGDCADAIAVAGGVNVTPSTNGGVNVSIPFSLETMPM
ncbi:hypothetical protein HDG34_002533 [Paraburkholderia sp. HC6.4b]|uniref:hypothetical protein n=1 Tax=unclassified Paraburkholderia TaxID=2615204 RepID=UPI00160F27AD|nr:MULTISPECIES: hypothetical protein [unclassified Paraburkholderia]MBB5408596.1 hypothetical protein [Paraburkholderia sp. HC6.4b]MBB5450428.1 hypothetical protein [Paraburkholderia sp. Kb1A]